MTAPKKAPPHLYCPYELSDVSALQALERGEADSDQQKRALAWVVNVASMTYQPTFMPDTHESAFAEGRRFVGLQTVKLLKVSLNALRKAQNHD